MITLTKEQEEAVLCFVKARDAREHAVQAHEAAKRELSRMSEWVGKLRSEENSKRSEMVKIFAEEKETSQSIGVDCPSVLKIRDKYYFMTLWESGEMTIEEIMKTNF